MIIGYICTNYNNSEYTINAINSLVSEVSVEFQVVVVDNNSIQSEINLLKNSLSYCEYVHIIFNNDNVGYFAGLNQGLDYILNLDLYFDWIVVGNNDLIFPANFLSQLSLVNEQLTDYPVVSPDIVTIDGEHQNPHVISNLSWLRELLLDIYYSNYYLGNIIKRVSNFFSYFTRRADQKYWFESGFISQGHGSCYLLGPKFFENFKELWAPTFLMAEEFFLSKQLSDSGYKIFYEPRIQVIHHWHGSLNKLPGRQRWNFARDAHRVYRKYVKIFKFF